jgi:hypothetical protein
VAAAMLIATGIPAPAAVNEVYDALDEVPSPHQEVFAAVFAEKLGGYRSWRAAKELQRRTVLQ